MTKKINVNTLMASTGIGFGTSGLRGLVAQMSDEVCYAYVTAFLQEVVGHATPIGKVVLGHDLRPSSPRIAKACASAIIDAGGQVVYAGALPTPAIAFYAMTTKAPAIIVTGSHIPFDRNGIKFYRADGEISKDDEYAIQQTEVEVPNELVTVALPEVNQSVADFYVRRYVDFFGADHFNGLRIASYEHSSVARDLILKILNALGAEVISLGRTESFVPIDTEAVRPEDVVQAKAWAHDYVFDAIFSTDGDADRPLIGDERGQWLRGDMVGILCAKFLAIDTIVTPVSSNTLAEKLAWFKSVMRTKIGSPYVIAAMEQAIDQNIGSVAGFEANGGFLLASEISRNGRILAALPTRDAVLPMLALLSFARELKCRLSDLVLSLPGRYTASDRLQNFPIQQSAKLLDILHKNHQLAAKTLAPNSGDIIAVDLTDGFRATFNNGDIVHLRPSGNAPELRCYAESDTQNKAQSLCDICLNGIKLYPQQLLNQAQLIHSSVVVEAAIVRLSKEITQALENTSPIVICVMGGGIVFAGQLLTQLKFPLELDYVHASRYQNETVGTTLNWKALPKLDLSGRTLLLVDDILDEGITLQAIKEKCLALGAKQVLSAVLVEKKLDHSKPIAADFVGLEVPDHYVFGCGMDIYGWWRNLPEIYALT